MDDVDSTLRANLMYHDPKRYLEVFEREIAAENEAMTLAGRSPEEVVEDLDEYDRYFAQLEEKRFMTGGEAFVGSGEWQ